VRGWCPQSMRLKLSLTVPLSLYKGEATRMVQLTIDYHHGVWGGRKTLRFVHSASLGIMRPREFG